MIVLRGDISSTVTRNMFRHHPVTCSQVMNLVTWLKLAKYFFFFFGHHLVIAYIYSVDNNRFWHIMSTALFNFS